jgi:hypothetical protein
MIVQFSSRGKKIRRETREASSPREQRLPARSDLNQDGISQGNEFLALGDIGITGINIASETTSNAQGNAISATGSFMWEDGHEGIVGTGQTGDIDFSVDTFHSTFTDTIDLGGGVEELPDRVGSGLAASSFCLQTAGDTKTRRRQCLWQA